MIDQKYLEQLKHEMKLLKEAKSKIEAVIKFQKKHHEMPNQEMDKIIEQIESNLGSIEFEINELMES